MADPFATEEDNELNELEQALFGSRTTLDPQAGTVGLPERKALALDPAEERTNQRKAERSGFDVEVIRDAPEIADDVELQALEESLFSESPITAGYLSRPRAAELAGDSIPHLQQIEAEARDMSWTQTFGRGVDIMQQLGYSAIQATGEVTGSDTLTDFGTEGAAEQEAELAKTSANSLSLKEAIDSPGKMFEFLQQKIGETMPLMAPSLAGGAGGAALGTVLLPGVGTVVGGVVGAFIPSFVFGIGETQQTVKKIDPNAQAGAMVFGGGALIGALDAFVPGKIGSKVVKEFGQETAERIFRDWALDTVKRGGSNATMEGITEGLQGIIAKEAAALETGTEIDLDAWEIAEEVFVGALMGGGLSVTTDVGQRMGVARKSKQGMDAIKSTMDATPVTQDLPEASIDHHVASLAASGITEVRIPVEVAIAHAQQNEHGGITTGLTDLGIADQVEGRNSGDEVVVPIENYVREVMLSPNYENVSVHSKVGSRGESLADAAADVRTHIDEIAKIIERDNPTTTEPAADAGPSVTDIGAGMAEILQNQVVMDALEASGVAEAVRSMATQNSEVAAAQELTTRANAEPSNPAGKLSNSLRERVDTALTQIQNGDVAEAAKILGALDQDVYAVVARLASEASELNPAFAISKGQGRLNRLSEEISGLDKQIDSLAKQIDERTGTGEPVIALANKLDKAIRERAVLDEEASHLVLPPTPEAAPSNARRTATSSAEATLETAVAARAELEVERERLQRSNKKLPAKFKKRITNANKAVDAAQAALDKVAKRVNSKLTLKESTLDSLGVTASRDAVRQVRKGFNEGIKAARVDRRQAVKALRTLIGGTTLDKGQKDRFRARLGSLDSIEQLQKQLPIIAAQISVEMEKQHKAQLGKALTRALRVGGKPKTGGLGPDGVHQVLLNDTLDALREANKVSKKIASQRLDGNPDDVVVDDLTSTDALSVLTNTIYQLKSDPAAVDIATLEALVASIEQLAHEGAALNKSMALYKVVDEKVWRDTTLDLIGEENIGWKGTQIEIAKKFVSGQLLGGSGAWWNKMLTIAQSSDSARVKQWARRFSMTEQNENFVQAKIDQTAKFTKAMKVALGQPEMTDKALLEKQQAMSAEIIDLGQQPSTREDGTPIHVRMTRAEMMQLLMNLQNEAVREDAMHPDGMAYSEDLIAQMKLAMRSEDNSIMNALMDYYRGYFPRINKAYGQAFGRSLSPVDSYAPLSKEYANQEADELLRGAVWMGSGTPTAFKKRVRNLRPIRQQSAFAVVYRHTMEMEYFIAFNEQVRFLNSVFKGHRSEVATRIKRNYGDQMWQTINADLDWFARKGQMAAAAGDGVFRILTRNFGIASLALKPQIMLKQLVSMVAFTQDVKMTDWVAGVHEFLKDIPAGLRILDETGFYKNRGLRLDQDFANMMDDQFGGKVINFLGRRPALVNMIMLNVHFGDKAAVAMGGFGHYSALRKQGMSKREALRSFKEIGDQTQQSSSPDQISEYQRSNNSFTRVMVQFLSSANAVARAEYQAIVEFKRKRIAPAEFAKRMLMLHFVVPFVIQLVANGFTWDNEDQLRASLFGAFNGWLIFGDAIEFISNWMFDNQTFGIQTRHPLEMAKDMTKVMTEFGDAMDWEDFNDAVDGIDAALGVAQGLTGAPLKNAWRMGFLGPLELSQGRPVEAAAMMFGYSPYTIKNAGLYLD